DEDVVLEGGREIETEAARRLPARPSGGEEGEAVEPESAERPAEGLLEELPRAGSLDSEESGRGVPPGDRGIRAAVLAKDLLDLVGPRRVRDDEESPGDGVAGVEAAHE